MSNIDQVKARVAVIVQVAVTVTVVVIAIATRKRARLKGLLVQDTGRFVGSILGVITVI